MTRYIVTVDTESADVQTEIEKYLVFYCEKFRRIDSSRWEVETKRTLDEIREGLIDLLDADDLPDAQSVHLSVRKAR